jgi:hypothetical protein
MQIPRFARDDKIKESLRRPFLKRTRGRLFVVKNFKNRQQLGHLKQISDALA